LKSAGIHANVTICKYDLDARSLLNRKRPPGLVMSIRQVVPKKALIFVRIDLLLKYRSALAGKKRTAR
jgi:hypothetical protein